MHLNDIIRQAQTKDMFLFEIMLRRKDGTIFPAESSGHLVDYEGKRTWISHIRDITERKLEENALQESREKYRNLVENISDVIFTLDLKGTITYISPVVQQLFGYTAQEVIDQHFSQFVHPDDLSYVIEGFRRRVAGVYEANEFRLLTKDGRERYVRTTQTPIVKEGVVTGFNYIMTDITERKQAEEALRKSENRFAQVVESAGEWIWEVDADGLYTYSSSAVEKILGYRLDEIVGRIHFYDLFAQDVKEELKKTALEAFATKEPFRGFINPNLHKNGNQVILETSGVPYLDEQGRLLGYRGTDTDITERKRAEDALHQANKKLNMLSSITRHDILNLIMAIRGYLELSEDMTDNPELKEFMKRENQAVDSIQRQIEFTRYYQDIGVDEPKWQDTETIVRNVTNELNLSGIAVENHLSGLEIFADPLIEKVFYNLVENSLRHGEHVTTITFSYSQTKSGLTLSYRDDGVGISPEYRKKLFQKGFGKHTGLGLFLSREILSITGITIRENGEPGKGVNFEILVPKGGYRFTARN